MGIAERRARLRARPGVLGRWCRALESVRARLHHAERNAASVLRRIGARLVRWFFDLLVLALLGLGELDVIRRKASHALADEPPKR